MINKNILFQFKIIINYFILKRVKSVLEKYSEKKKFKFANTI